MTLEYSMKALCSKKKGRGNRKVIFKCFYFTLISKEVKISTTTLTSTLLSPLLTYYSFILFSLPFPSS